MAPSVGVPRLYLRPDEAAPAIGVSKRTLSEWQATRVVPFRRVGRTILFYVPEVLEALNRYRVAPIGEPKPRKADAVELRNAASPPMKRKRHMARIKRTPSTAALE